MPRRNEHGEHWCDRAEKKTGTWWEGWTQWLGERCGDEVAADPAASDSFPALADAPGTYGLEK